MSTKQFDISKLYSSTVSANTTYTFTTTYRYVLVMIENDYSDGSVTLTSSTGTITLKYSLLINSSHDYATSHSGSVYLVTDVVANDYVTFTASRPCAMHIYSLSTDLKNEIEFSSIGTLSNNSDTSNRTRTYTTSEDYDAVFIHEIMGEVDEMPSSGHDSFTVPNATWNLFVHSGHEGNTTGAMATGYTTQVSSGTSYSVTTRSNPVTGYEDINTRSYIVFGITIVIVPSTIYKGDELVSKVYLGDEEISSVYIGDTQIYGT